MDGVQPQRIGRRPAFVFSSCSRPACPSPVAQFRLVRRPDSGLPCNIAAAATTTTTTTTATITIAIFIFF
ncbi:unnamed protein product [Protopolystoma xenopodis]|uniref:Uncharacterized protein n=1 Tax=Protopolystoma xenopodis TaxID=117903 RepID=A0A3S5ANA9_9PLAT|nr:unnamed protein product [Protopolystoma xenopodis]